MGIAAGSEPEMNFLACLPRSSPTSSVIASQRRGPSALTGLAQQCADCSGRHQHWGRSSRHCTSPPPLSPVARHARAARATPVPASYPGGVSRACLPLLAGVPVPQAIVCTQAAVVWLILDVTGLWKKGTVVLDVLMATGAEGLGWAGWGTGLDTLPNSDGMQAGLCCGTFGNSDREGCAQGKQDCVLATACCPAPYTCGHAAQGQWQRYTSQAGWQIAGVGAGLSSNQACPRPSTPACTP